VKAVFLNTSKLFGGVEKNFIVRAAAMEARGHEIHVVAGSPLIYDHLKKASLRNVALIPCSNDYNFIFFFRFIRLLIKVRPDVVFLNTKRDFWRGGVPARLTRITRIVGYWGSDYNVGNLWKINFVFSHILDRLIVNSHDLKQRLLRRNFPIVAEEVFVVYNGFDSAMVPAKLKPVNLRSTYNIPSDSILLGTAGRLVGFKRFELAFPILAKLREKHDVHLVIAGAGNKYAVLQEAARKAGVAEQVHFAGEIQEIYKTTFYEELDAFVFFSEDEGLANVLIEASYFNTFAFVLDSPGMSEVIVNGLNGIICRDTNSFLTSLDQHIADRSFQKTSARPYVEDKFSISQMVSRTESVFFE
jgi:glycosyltransferase involved in cell wall biosynthesis